MILFLMTLLFCWNGFAPDAATASELPHAIYPKPGSSDAISAKSRGSERLLLFKGIATTKGPPPKGSMTVLGITAGKSTMVDVEAVLGQAVPIIVGEAADNETSVCYRGSDGTVLVFTSDEISPGIGGIEFYKSQKAAGRTQCSKSQKVNRAIATDFGIRLGDTKVEVHQKFGKPQRRSGNVEVFFWRTPLGEQQCENSAFYILRFEKERVRSFQFASHDSC